VHLLAD